MEIILEFEECYQTICLELVKYYHQGIKQLGK